jgi:hypothetical protein
MDVSERQLTANRENAKYSTGPKSKNGQAVACQNATQHGLFSSQLLLEGEDPAEFQELLANLETTLRPVGAVELRLVERVAVTMWRQRRLVRAETATLRLARQPKKIASGVSSELGLCFSAELKEDDLMPFDTEQAEWCKKVVEEIEALEELDFEIEFKTLPKAAPLFFAQLKSDAEDDGEDIAAYLKDYDNGLSGYARDIARWCREELCKAEKRPHVLALADQLRAKRLVLPPDTLELFTRYQTTLDNQLYKALRAFRETQEWRLKTLDVAGEQDKTS